MLTEIGNAETVKRTVGRNLLKLCKVGITTTTSPKRVAAEESRGSKDTGAGSSGSLMSSGQTKEKAETLSQH